MRILLALAMVSACAFTPESPPVGVDPGEGGGGGGGTGSGGGGGGGSGSGTVAIPDIHCAGVPDAGPAGSFNHISSDLIAALGSPTHRGFDLVTPASTDAQLLSGKIGYTIADKSLEDEDVDVFACRQSAWQKVGTTRTDADGQFQLALTGADRLPIGMRDLYVSVVGDRTGTEFLAFVAPDGAKLMVSDVDGTLTESENRFAEAQLLGVSVGVQPGAPQAYAAAAAKGYTLVYLTARGNRFTDATRQWLADQGFPRGPLHLATSFLTLPGSDTIAFKTGALAELGAGFDIAAGVGNRDSDISAYTAANVAADRIFIKLPEYATELAPDLAANKAIGFMAYDDLRVAQIAHM